MKPASFDPLDKSYDYAWDAGRFKARVFNSEGMDAPAEFRTGRVCVGHQETVSIPINNIINTMPPNVKTLKVVASWYDPDHQYKRRRDHYAIRVITHEKNKSLNDRTIGVDAANNLEDKARVIIDDVGAQYENESLSLLSTGINVGGSQTICGENANVVYYTAYYEAEDRSDLNGPDDSIETTPQK